MPKKLDFTFTVDKNKPGTAELFDVFTTLLLVANVELDKGGHRINTVIRNHCKKIISQHPVDTPMYFMLRDIMKAQLCIVELEKVCKALNYIQEHAAEVIEKGEHPDDTPNQDAL